jgi:hypothetical protein
LIEARRAGDNPIFTQQMERLAEGLRTRNGQADRQNFADAPPP